MKLFQSGRIGQLHIKNRIVMASMNTSGSVNADGTLSQRGIEYYVARAKGGIGLIITGTCRVSRDKEYDPRMHRILFADGGVHVAWLSELAEAVHDQGGKIAVQLQSGRGRVVSGKVAKNSVVVAPSATPCFFDSNVVAREISIKEIEALIEAFRVAAETVRMSGVDAIELNFHGGYLGDQFMSSLWNKRSDKYGGNIEGRLRFPIEVIEATKRGAGNDFPLIFKFGLTHYINGGREIKEGLEIAQRVEAAGVNALAIDAGCYESRYWTFPDTYQAPGCLVDLSEMVKKAVNIPVIAVGKLGYPELAERVLKEGKADFVALGRALLADPEWPNKMRQGRLEDICPCIGDNEGCLRRSMEQKYVSCSVNPMTGMEREFALQPTKKKKSVLVVGGGPAGMEAARVSAIRGHKVTIWEKNETLGGNLIPASIPEFKKDYKRLIDYLSTQVKKLGITIQLGKEGTSELVEKMRPDVVFIATGAEPIIPKIPGVQEQGVYTAVDVLLGNKEVGNSAIIIGGGIVGCETALYLMKKGKQVTVLEALDSVMYDAYPINRMHLLNLISSAKILTETAVLEINDKGVIIENENDKNKILTGDTVIIAVGFRSRKELFESLKNKCSETYIIGDCVKPRKIINAIWEGFRIARMI